MVIDRVSAWMRQAEHDLAHAETALAARSFDWVCYAASQAAEKFLKAGLISTGEDHVWGHNLHMLLDGLAKGIGSGPCPDGLADDARLLTQYTVLTRYPLGDQTTAPMDMFSHAHAVAALEAAKRLRDWTLAHVLHARKPLPDDPSEPVP